MSNHVNDLITVATPQSEVEAQVLVDALNDAGIKAVAFASATGGTALPFPGGVAVQVPEADVDRAKAIIADVGTEGAQIDWDNVDVGEAEGDGSDA
jgi:hypothetical protein